MIIKHCAKCGEMLTTQEQDRGSELCDECENEYNEM